MSDMRATQRLLEWSCADAPGVRVTAYDAGEAAMMIERACAGVHDLPDNFGERVRAVNGCACQRVPVLCGCGWGRLSLPECQVPESCPVCGFDFWSAFGIPPECTP